MTTRIETVENAVRYAQKRIDELSLHARDLACSIPEGWPLGCISVCESSNANNPAIMFSWPRGTFAKKGVKCVVFHSIGRVSFATFRHDGFTVTSQTAAEAAEDVVSALEKLAAEEERLRAAATCERCHMMKTAGSCVPCSDSALKLFALMLAEVFATGIALEMAVKSPATMLFLRDCTMRSDAVKEENAVNFGLLMNSGDVYTWDRMSAFRGDTIGIEMTLDAMELRMTTKPSFDVSLLVHVPYNEEQNVAPLVSAVKEYRISRNLRADARLRLFGPKREGV